MKDVWHIASPFESAKRSLLFEMLSATFRLIFFVSISLFHSCALMRGFGGVTLKVVVHDGPPYAALKLDGGNYTMLGPDAKIFEWLARRLNFTISIVPSIDEALIARVGIYDAAFSEVVNKGADVLIGCFVITPGRAKIMDYTSSLVWAEPYNLVTPVPEYESRLFAFIYPFEPFVWLGMSLSILAFTGVMSFFTSVYQNSGFTAKTHGKTNCLAIADKISSNFMYAICILTNHGANNPFCHYSFRFLVGCWLLAAFVLTNSYSSIVVSSLTVPKLKAPVNSFEDLISNTEVTMIAQKTVILSQMILDSKSGTLFELGNQLRKHPERLFIDFPSAYKKVEEGRYALPWMSSNNAFFVATQFRKDGKCRFRLSDPLQVTQFTSGTLMQKNSKYRWGINSGEVELWETGLTPFWFNQMIPRADRCFDKNSRKSTTAVPIKLVDLTSAFLVLGFGTGLSLIAFLVEKMSF